MKRMTRIQFLALTCVFFSFMRGPVEDRQFQAIISSNEARPKAQISSKFWYRLSNRTPSAEQLDTYRRLSEMAAKMGPPGESQSLSADPEVIGRIEGVQRFIQTASPPEHAWHWEEVRETVASFGVSIPFLFQPSSTSEEYTAAGYDIWRHALYVWGPILRGRGDLYLASVFVHEATHAVVAKHLRELTGLTKVDFTVIDMRCPDTRFQIGIIQELLAHLNQAAWLIDHPAHDNPELMIQLGNYMQGLSRDRSAKVQAIHSIVEYAEWQEGMQQEQARRLRVQPFPSCGPMVDSSKTRLFVPSDIAEEYLGPWLAAY